ncbi:hypothetical protein PSEUDO9AZ_30002 [Pseudomonas sp. 9AZ]|nr:hypothetical protein PSEUDO9AZ_30002 [Pseudomonas sp. 9AZ]
MRSSLWPSLSNQFAGSHLNVCFWPIPLKKSRRDFCS